MFKNPCEPGPDRTTLTSYHKNISAVFSRSRMKFGRNSGSFMEVKFNKPQEIQKVLTTAAEKAVGKITEAKRKAEGDYIALGKKTSGWLGDQAKGHLKIIIIFHALEALQAEQTRFLKIIGDAEHEVKKASGEVLIF